MTSFISFTRRKRISASIHILLGVMAAYPQAAAQAQQASGGTLPAVRVQGNRDEGYSPAAAASATKSSAPLRDIPQAVNVVPQQVIRDQAARSVQDVLRNVPGVGMSNGDGQRDQVTIRGFSAIADQFVDGIRDDALYFRDLSNIERVEVLKGPAAVLYGRGSSGGLINRVTKKPQEGRFGELTLNAGSYGLKRTSFDANTGIADGVAVRLTGAYEDTGSFRQQGFIERHSIAPSVSAALGDATKLLVQGEFAKDKRITDFGIPSFNGRPVNVPRETYYGSGEARRDDYTATEVASVTAAIDHRFNEIVSVRNATRYYTYDLDRNNTLPGGTVDTVTRTVGRNRGQIQREEYGYFNQTDFTIRNSLGGVRQEWLLGMEFGKQNKFQQSVNQANIDRVSIFNPGGVVAPPISAATRNSLASRPRDSDFKVFGLYAQDQISLTSQLKALLGVRHDTFKQETRTGGILIPLARQDKKLSPRAGLVWQPT
ncbi:MAG: TonB-dependent receptor, partial [Alphaproteobacteria bacterium]